jgi:[pyruvate, water dikinase]-phosphate phosphotransferase / [pyruvate, water dikinase] kinase
MATETRHSPVPPLIIVSGGTGTSGEQVVNTVLAQFPDAQVPVVILSSIRRPEQIEGAIAQAVATGGAIVHTLVDDDLRRQLIDRATRRGVVTLDLMGPLLAHLAHILNQAPLGRPGFYRQIHRTYFERVAAIEYAMAHDDGLNHQGWPDADVVLVGVSRTGKTPLSIYLSVLGWKAANMPLVPQIPIPPELYRLDRSRVIGLTIGVDRLLVFRRQRAQAMGLSSDASYAQPGEVARELAFARDVFQRGGFHVINVTERPVEASADEIIRRIGQVR